MVEGYTEEFEASFLELLRQSHPFSRVAAKVVYNDYIANKCGSRITLLPVQCLLLLSQTIGKLRTCRRGGHRPTRCAVPCAPCLAHLLTQ